MKRILAFLSAAILFQFCTDEKAVITTPQKAQFSFTLANGGGRILANSLPPGSALLVSIEKPSGESVFSFKKVALVQIGSEYISEAVTLFPGEYYITDFLLVNDSSKVLFATPKQGAPLANLVAHPLPVGFSVSQNISTAVTLEVVSAVAVTPQQLGYVSFGLQFVYPMALSASAYENGSAFLTDAESYLLTTAGDTVQHFSLSAGDNPFAFAGDPDAVYYLHTIKPGYGRAIYRFQYSTTGELFGGFPLNISLYPALTFVGHMDSISTDSLFTVSLYAHEGQTALVSWGDGSGEEITYGEYGYARLEHKFLRSGNFFITVDHPEYIEEFYTAYDGGKLDQLNLEHVPMLSGLTMVITRSPRVLDLRHNFHLTGMNLLHMRTTESVLLPWDNLVRGVNISGPNFMTSESVNSMIDAIHHSAVADNFHEGRFEWLKIWYDGSQDQLVPISPHARAQLLELANDYEWTVIPLPE